MVTQITLGNFSSQNGRTVVTGTSSGGIDTEALTNALAEARRLPAVRLESRIESNLEISEAYSEMQDILSRFREASNFLRNPPGVRNQLNNVFEYRNSSVSGTTSLAASNYLSVTAEAGTSLGSYRVEIAQLATSNTKITNSFALADSNQAVAVGAGAPLNAGTLTLGASGVSVVLTDGDTLESVIAKVNAVRNQSGVGASILKTADGEFRLVFKTTATGTDANYTLDAASLAVFSGVGLDIEEDAVNAELTVDGIDITRQSNSVSDAISGITFNLLAETGVGERLNVAVTADTSLARDAIFSFVDAYNEFRVFAAKQLETESDGTRAEGALLASSSTLRATLSRIDAEMASVIGGLGGFNRLADIGLNFSDFAGDEETPLVRNIVTIDEAKLDSALAANFDQVRDLFEFDFTSDNPNLTVFSRTNVSVNEVQLIINQTSGIYQAVYDLGAGPVTVDLDATSLSGGGVTLTGKAGTAIAGLTLIYSASNDTVTNLSLTQGFGDRLYNTLDEVLREDRGLLTVEISTLAETNQRLEREITRIDEIVTRYREQLIAQFAALERAISQSDIILQSLNAQANAQLAASG